jgi:hypothetical protein
VDWDNWAEELDRELSSDGTESQSESAAQSAAATPSFDADDSSALTPRSDSPSDSDAAGVPALPRVDEEDDSALHSEFMHVPPTHLMEVSNGVLNHGDMYAVAQPELDSGALNQGHALYNAAEDTEWL